MSWLLSWIRRVFTLRRRTASRRELMSMYLNESNSVGKRKANRERA